MNGDPTENQLVAVPHTNSSTLARRRGTKQAFKLFCTTAFFDSLLCACLCKKKKRREIVDLFSKKIWTFSTFCGIVVC